MNTISQKLSFSGFENDLFSEHFYDPSSHQL